MEENPTLKIENVLQQTHCWIIPKRIDSVGYGLSVGRALLQMFLVVQFIGHIWFLCHLYPIADHKLHQTYVV